MANNINWGKIYESTAWGSGVDNSIGWGDSYADLAGGGPKNTLAPVISGTAERGETLTSTTGTWTGTGTITYAYQWKRNGADISGATASTYVLVSADDNALMTCVVSATDTEGTKSATSNTLGPVLAAPLNLTSPVASGTAQVGETLSTTDGTWQGIATITFAYQWRRNAVNISGATSSTYTLVAADYTTDIDCVVTATNSLGSASADSNDIANIAGTAPSITSLPTISGTIEVLQTITATLGSVTGVPTPTSTLQWQISNDGVSGWTNIVGETSTTYTIAVEDDDKYLRVVQTATNAEGSDVENSASTTQVAGSAPVISGVPTLSGTAKVGSTLTATAASVTGVPTPTTSWQWQRSDDGSTGWANISGATSTTYVLVEADDTNYVRAVQTSTNAVGSDSANSAASAQISQGSAFDADYQAVLDRASTLGYTAPSAAQQTLQNTLVEDLKTAGVWSKLDAFYLFATDGDSDYATLNFVAPSNFQATKTNSPTFTADEGFTGDGVSAYLDTNLNQANNTTNYTQDAASFGVYAWNDIGGTGEYPMSADNLSTRLRWAQNTGANRINHLSTPSPRGNISTNRTGLIGLNRTSSTAWEGLDESGSINTGYGGVSKLLQDKNFVILKFTSNYSANKIGVAWVGGSFTSAEWSDYVDAVDTYIAAL